MSEHRLDQCRKIIALVAQNFGLTPQLIAGRINKVRLHWPRIVAAEICIHRIHPRPSELRALFHRKPKTLRDWNRKWRNAINTNKARAYQYERLLVKSCER